MDCTDYCYKDCFDPDRDYCYNTHYYIDCHGTGYHYNTCCHKDYYCKRAVIPYKYTARRVVYSVFGNYSAERL